MESWILDKYFNMQNNFLILWEVVISFLLRAIKAEDEQLFGNNVESIKTLN